jgi:hypothetical protein
MRTRWCVHGRAPARGRPSSRSSVGRHPLRRNRVEDPRADSKTWSRLEDGADQPPARRRRAGRGGRGAGRLRQDDAPSPSGRGATPVRSPGSRSTSATTTRLSSLRHTAAALHRIEPLAPSVLGALASSRRSIWQAGRPAPRIRRRAARRAVRPRPRRGARARARRLDGRGRGPRRPPRARIDDGARRPCGTPPSDRVSAGERRLLELGPDLLALTPREARLVIRGADVDLSTAAEAALVDRRRAGRRPSISARSRSARAAGRTPSFAGTTATLADYIRAECLARLRPKQLAFLRRSSCLTEDECSALRRDPGQVGLRARARLARPGQPLPRTPRPPSWVVPVSSPVPRSARAGARRAGARARARR